MKNSPKDSQKYDDLIFSILLDDITFIKLITKISSTYQKQTISIPMGKQMHEENMEIVKPSIPSTTSVFQNK